MVNDVKTNPPPNSNIQNNSNDALNVHKAIINLEYKVTLLTLNNIGFDSNY